MIQNNVSGFNIIELMVTVAIVGVLSNIAMVNYDGFVGKARSAEARSNLGIFAKAQLSHQLSTGSFTECTANLVLDLVPARNYYAVGFETSPLINISCGRDGTKPCDQLNFDLGIGAPRCAPPTKSIGADKSINPAPVPAPNNPGFIAAGSGFRVFNRGAFRAVAKGYVSRPGNALSDTDEWYIDERLTLIHQVPGY